MKPFNLSLGCDLVWDSVGSFIGCELCSTTRSMWGIPRLALLLKLHIPILPKHSWAFLSSSPQLKLPSWSASACQGHWVGLASQAA